MKVKVSHSLIAVGAVGISGLLYLWQNMWKGGVNPSAFPAFSFSDSKKVTIYGWIDKDSFQSSDGKVGVRTKDLPVNPLDFATGLRRLPEIK